jgi:hypothetical protein
MALTPNEFRRLDFETQQDILINLAHNQRQQQEREFNVTPAR